MSWDMWLLYGCLVALSYLLVGRELQGKTPKPPPKA